MGFRARPGSGGGTVVFGAPTDQIDLDDPTAVGVSNAASRSDHQHAFPGPPAGSTVAVAAASAVGASVRPARADHTHSHTRAHHLAGGHADLSADFDAAGAATAARTAHEGAADPHPVYLTQPEGDAFYEPVNLPIRKGLLTAKGDLIAATAAGAPARLAVGADGQLLTADAASAGGVKWAAAPASPLTKIATQTVGIGGAAAITFAAIPQGYKDLLLRGYLRSGQAASASTVTRLQFNGDTANNYDAAYVYNGGTGAAAAANGIECGSVLASLATAGVASVVDILILGYSAALWQPTVLFRVGSVDPVAGSSFFYSGSGKWRTVAAINSLSMTLNVGLPSLVQNSTLTLYGIS